MLLSGDWASCRKFLYQLPVAWGKRGTILTIGEGNGTPLQYSCLENPWTEEPGRLQSMGSLTVGHA